MRIGYFTQEQLLRINAARASSGFPLLRAEIVFRGLHLYESRYLADAYSIDEILEQIQSAFSVESEIDFAPPSSLLRNPRGRIDRNGILVHDEAVFECTSRHPYAALFSVIPKGDGKKGRKK